MPRKTSFCNGTLLRSDLRHYWPAGFLYVLVWLVLLPIPLLQTGFEYARSWADRPELLAAELHNIYYSAMTGSMVLAVLAGIVMPMAVYAYLMAPRAVGLMHALPVKRTTQYFSHFAAGFGLLTGGNVLIFLLSVLAQLPYGGADWAAAGLWLLVTELLELFFLSLGTLCAMATGWLLAIPVLYGAVNFTALLLCTVVQYLQRLFYFGFDSTTYPVFVEWLTPTITLSEAVCSYWGDWVTRDSREVYLRALPERALTVLAVYTAAALALLALGWLLYRRRPSEAAGDAIAFRWLRPVVRWSVGLCGGLGLGLFLSTVVLGGFGSGIVKLILCQIFMGLLCFFAVQMLLQKTFRVFRRSWKEAAALVLALSALTLAIRADIFGVQRRVPDPARVDSVSLRITYYDGGYCDTDDPAIIEAAAALHRAILAQGDSAPENGDGWMEIRLFYDLKNGDSLRRDYGIIGAKGSEVYRLANQLLNMPQFRIGAMGLDWLDTAGLDSIRGGYVRDGYTDAEVSLTREQAVELCRLAQQDAAGTDDTDALGALLSGNGGTANTDTDWDMYRYQVVIYGGGEKGQDEAYELTMMSYCTRMRDFITGLDFPQTTVDPEAAPEVTP